MSFTPKLKGEADLPEIWEEPLPCVVSVLSQYADYEKALDNLPDIELIGR